MPPGRQEMVMRSAPPARRRELLDSSIEELQRLRVAEPGSALQTARKTVRLARIAQEQELHLRALLELGNLYRILGHDDLALAAYALVERSLPAASAGIRVDFVLYRSSQFNAMGRWTWSIRDLVQLGHCGREEGRRQTLLASAYEELGAVAESDRAAWTALQESERRDDLALTMVTVNNLIGHRMAAGARGEAETLFDRSEGLYSVVGGERARIARDHTAATIAIVEDGAESGADRMAAIRDAYLTHGLLRNALHAAVWQIAVVCHRGTGEHLLQVLDGVATAVEAAASVRGVSFRALAERRLSRRDLWQELRRMTRAIGGTNLEPLYRSSP